MSDNKARAGRQELEAIRRQIDEDMKAIHSVARILSAFRQFDRDTVQIDPVALGLVHEMIVSRVLAVYDILDSATRKSDS